MARNSRGLDKKLLKVGRKLIQIHGIQGFSLRTLAKTAGVNLGMITYHFGSKNAYLKALLLEIYSPFLVELEFALSKPSGSSQEIVRAQLFIIAQFSNQNAGLILPLLVEVVQGNSIVIKLLKKDFVRHFDVLKRGIEQYLIDQGYEQALTEQVFRHFVATVALSNLLFYVQATLNQKDPVIEDNILERHVEAALLSITAFGSSRLKVGK